jgi:hypothetical protein
MPPEVEITRDLRVRMRESGSAKLTTRPSGRGRARLRKLGVAAYPPYEEYPTKTTRRIPVFLAEPNG